MACGANPTKVTGSIKILPRLSQIYDEWRTEEPPTTIQLSIKANVPKLLAEHGRTELDHAVGDLSLIVFYYLLCIEENTIKGKCNKAKKMVQF